MRKVPPIKKLKQICSKKKKLSSWTEVQFRKVSIYLTKLLLYTPITGNQVTFLSLLIGMIGGLVLSVGTFWSFFVGTLVFIFHNILDLSDGEVARYRKTITFRGQYLARFTHYVVDTSMDIGLVVGTYKLFGSYNILLFGITMVIFGMLIKYASAAYQITTLKIKPNKDPYTLADTLIGRLNIIFLSHEYLTYYIIIATMIDHLLILPHSLLVVLIVTQTIGRLIKFFVMVPMSYFK